MMQIQSIHVFVSVQCTFSIYAYSYEVPFAKYGLHAPYEQFYAFPTLSLNGNEKSWTDFCGL